MTFVLLFFELGHFMYLFVNPLKASDKRAL